MYIVQILAKATLIHAKMVVHALQTLPMESISACVTLDMRAPIVQKRSMSVYLTPASTMALAQYTTEVFTVTLTKVLIYIIMQALFADYQCTCPADFSGKNCDICKCNEQLSMY